MHTTTSRPRSKQPRFQLLLVLLLATGLSGFATAAVDLDFTRSTPVGSWALTEQTTTDHKGRQSVTRLRMSMLSKEQRNGQTYYWAEIVTDMFKVSKKGERKKNGDRMIVKTLVPESTIKGDPANAFKNLQGLGEEMIFQTGDSAPMKMDGAGAMAQSMMKMTGSTISYDFTEEGREQVSTAAGNFDTQIVKGNGSAKIKVVFKTMNVVSSVTSYYSNEVPFGVVKAIGQDVTDGKTSNYTSELLEYGTSGATSLIVGTPEEMPAMPNFKDLLGGG